MKGRIVFNYILITTLLLSRPVFAGTDNEYQHEKSVRGASDVEAITASLQNKLEDENYAEVLMRIRTDAREHGLPQGISSGCPLFYCLRLCH